MATPLITYPCVLWLADGEPQAVGPVPGPGPETNAQSCCQVPARKAHIQSTTR
jgi:hypothetical protein